MATLKNLQTKIANLQAKADEIIRKQSAGVVARIHALMDEHGLTLDDLRAAVPGNRRGHKADKTAAPKKSGAAPKYRDPKSGATWSGHGRAPGWIANARNRARFLIDADAKAASAAPATKAKPVGNYVRGPQPPKYRDPKSGAEWSGRGKAPSWLAAARDRTKFLIDPEAPGGVTGKAVKKTAAKKTSARKTARKLAVKKGAARKVAAEPAATQAAASSAAVSEE